MTPRKRADILLVERGLFESRAKAQAAIAAGLVTAGGVTLRKASDGVALDAELTAAPAHPWVSRGGVKLATALDPLLRRPAQLVALIKPQFEAGRANVKKGVVRDAAIHAAVCADIVAFAASRGWDVAGVIPSPIEGGDGNAEFLLAACRA